MPRRRSNTQMFALPAPPPGRLTVAGRAYALTRVFKHDFFAATCLYEAEPGLAGGGFPRIVVKIYRVQGFCGLPGEWMGRLSRDHEKGIYAALAGVAGVPRYVGDVGETGLAIKYIDAAPLDHLDAPPAGYFDRLRAVFDAVHARGVAYSDANKRSNILVTDDGRPFLIDFQIALRPRPDWPWPARPMLASFIRYLQGKDIYHLCKHKRRLAPAELSAEEDALSRRRSGWHLLHRRLTKPYRALRRRLLADRYRAGRIVSPTAELEDHELPEQETWKR
jgi:hypothetical protein